MRLPDRGLYKKYSKGPFFGPTTFHQGRQLFKVVGPDVQQLFLAKPLTLPTWPYQPKHSPNIALSDVNIYDKNHSVIHFSSRKWFIVILYLLLLTKQIARLHVSLISTSVEKCSCLLYLFPLVWFVFVLVIVLFLLFNYFLFGNQ